ncbi:transposase [Aquimarina aggregata]|uniref:Transposase n=1 Tax=Aquimarina aggregata TaxID=1642818 RepID=A0A162Z4W3_9FLAO|nr:transposase [Aquimarina aggregata]KZS39562.1 transposase [Aquimarina aggregata]
MKYEVVQPNQYYHIYNQGNNKENLFIEEKNYTYFLKLLKNHILPIANIHCYCLLPNHFHLLIKTKHNLESKIISQGFSNLFNAYAKAINKMYNRTGSLFKRKFSRIRITDEVYFKNLVLYIHTNAEHHQITKDFRRYPHSSYHAYLSNKKTSIFTDYVLDTFDGKSNFEYAHIQKKVFIEAKYTLK